MPLRNRVTPSGHIEAVAARGGMMGNRGGCFHTPVRTLARRHWASRQWICCVLAFKGRRRAVMRPGHYTELFFLDEATALSAGHRPCFECRRADANEFARIWAAALDGGQVPTAPQMDVRLHADRLRDDGGKRHTRLPVEQVPDGAFVRNGEAAALVVGQNCFISWSHGGYVGPVKLRDGMADVLTPAAILAILSAGYRPMLHPTAVPFLPPDHSFRTTPTA